MMRRYSTIGAAIALGLSLLAGPVEVLAGSPQADAHNATVIVINDSLCSGNGYLFDGCTFIHITHADGDLHWHVHGQVVSGFVPATGVVKIVSSVCSGVVNSAGAINLQCRGTLPQ